MHIFSLRCICLVMLLALSVGCSSYQPTKNVWKGTKSLWYTYVSPPASVDYDDKGALSPKAQALTNSMMEVDVELAKLERVMLNADRPPTREFMTSFFSMFPWMGGFAGVKNDGSILGREPATNLKEIDFIPLLYEDAKQNSRALRGDVQVTPLGPEVILATPLYDGIDFLGIVAAHFDFRSLMQYSHSPQNMVVLSPYALLWPGEYDFASTPLAGVDWKEAVAKSSSGTCTNANGTFYYMVRYLGNLPLVFAVAENGNFPKGDESLEQGLAFFPKEREKLPPPPLPERKEKATVQDMPSFDASSSDHASPAAMSVPQRDTSTEIQPGSQNSVLMQQQHHGRKDSVKERQLEGENVEVEKIQRPRQRKPQASSRPRKQSDSQESSSPREVERPSPFGPREEAPQPVKRPSPFGPEAESAKPAPAASVAPRSEGTAETTNESTAPKAPAKLPGGRPSPFGPQ